MATALEQLMEQLKGNEIYKPLTDEQIRAQAQQRYRSLYDQKRLSARQSYENDDAALARELAGLQKSYDDQRASSAAQTSSAYSQADRHALSRGMQRSSYNEANLTGISLAGQEALREIDREQSAHEAQIGQQRTQLSTQLSQTLQQLETDRQNDEQAYIDQLAQREYDRGVNSLNTANELAMKLYEYQHQLEAEAAEQARWQAEFNARYGDGSVSRGRTSSRKSSASAEAVKASASSGASHVQKNQKQSQY